MSRDRPGVHGRRRDRRQRDLAPAPAAPATPGSSCRAACRCGPAASQTRTPEGTGIIRAVPPAHGAAQRRRCPRRHGPRFRPAARSRRGRRPRRRPAGAARMPAAGAAAVTGSGGSAATCRGTNTGDGSGDSTPRRTWSRQDHSRLRLTSCRRATSTKRAPGLSASATIRSLSSSRQWRRRSTPVMISMRPPASDLSDARTNVGKIRRRLQP